MIARQHVAAFLLAVSAPSVAVAAGPSKPKPSSSALGQGKAAESPATAADAGSSLLPPSGGAAPGTAPPASTAGAAAEPAPAPASVPIPPSAEVGQLKVFGGSWRCEGSVTASALGPARKYTATATVTPALDQHWYEIHYEQKKSKDNPAPQKMRMVWGYDVEAKRFHRAAHTNAGTWDVGSSPGWQGNTWVWTGETAMHLGKVPFRNTVVRKSDRELTLSTELQLGGQWLSAGADTCRR